MTVADLIKSLIDSSRDRIKTPIAGAYTLAFVLYNWRPIVLLMFSSAEIEDKIVVINHEYCFWSSILWPIAIAFIFTAGVPTLMFGIDKLLVKVKKGRTENIYLEKADVLDGQIRVAKQELLLQNVLSGNKEKEDLIYQIDQLKIENLNLQETNKLNTENYNRQIKELNENFRRQIDLDESLISEEGIPIAQYVLFADLLGDSVNDFLTRIPSSVDQPVNKINLSPNTVSMLNENKLIKIVGDDFFLTKRGIDFQRYLRKVSKDNK